MADARYLERGMRLRWDTSMGGVVEKEVKIILIIIKIILHHNQNPKNYPDHTPNSDNFCFRLVENQWLRMIIGKRLELLRN